MENLKVKVNNESERKEIERSLVELGYNFVNNLACENGFVVASLVSSGVNFDYWADVKEIKLQYLRDLVVLKRNSIEDATHYYGGSKYYLTDSEFYQYSGNKWVNIDQYVDGMTFKKMEKGCEMKEFLNPEQGYSLVKCFIGETPIPKSWIEVPEGAEVLTGLKEDKYTLVFWKPLTGEVYKDGLFKSYSYHKSMSYEEYKSNWINNCVLWERNPTTPNTSTQDKLKFIEKWLNGEKIQYILGIETDKTQADKSKVDKSQWHNFTEGAMQYIKRPDIKFREAPKYVTINGIEFNSVKSLLKNVKNNFDLEDGD